MRALGVLLSILAMLLGVSGGAWAGDLMKHSGFVESIAEDGTTFVLAEVGPWHERNGVTASMHRTITLTPETEFAIVARAEAAASGFAGDFVEVEMGPVSVFLSDYVTVECRHEGRRQVALKVTVIHLPAAATEGQVSDDPARPWDTR